MSGVLGVVGAPGATVTGFSGTDGNGLGTTAFFRFGVISLPRTSTGRTGFGLMTYVPLSTLCSETGKGLAALTEPGSGTIAPATGAMARSSIFGIGGTAPASVFWRGAGTLAGTLAGALATGRAPAAGRLPKLSSRVVTFLAISAATILIMPVSTA